MALGYCKNGWRRAVKNYICSPTGYSVLMSEFIQHLCYLYMFRTSPVHLQERFLQAVFADLVCGNTRTTTS